MIVDEEAVVLDSAVIVETKDYEEPFWLNKELQQVMVIIIYPDGKRLPASVSGEGGNPDYIAIMEKFTEEQIDAKVAELAAQIDAKYAGKELPWSEHKFGD